MASSTATASHTPVSKKPVASPSVAGEDGKESKLVCRSMAAPAPLKPHWEAASRDTNAIDAQIIHPHPYLSVTKSSMNSDPGVTPVTSR